jgi:hypothetical protein
MDLALFKSRFSINIRSLFNNKMEKENGYIFTI